VPLISGWFRSLSFASLLWLGCAHGAETFVLFHADGNPVEGYDRIVENLKVGDRVQFGDGKKFLIRSILGQGKSSLILAVNRSRAIKIPLNTAAIPLLNDLLTGYRELRRLGVPLVQIYELNSLPGQYISLEELEPHPALGRLMSLSEFAEGQVPEFSTLFAVMAAELQEFAEKCFHIAKFGDQGPSQVLYTRRGWRLVDFRRNHQLARSTKDGIPFGSYFDARSLPRSCGQELASLLHDMGESATQTVLVVPHSIETAIRLAIFLKRLRFFGPADVSESTQSGSPIFRPI